MSGDPFAPFRGQKYLNLETYRKSGEPVRTPLWFVEDGGALCASTAAGSPKVKRLRANSRVRVVPCRVRGEPKGEWVEAEARVVEGEMLKRIHRLLLKKYHLMALALGVVSMVRGWERAGIEIRAK